MCRRPDTWHYPYDFMPPRLSMNDPCFVGYEATARMAELRKAHPEMIETMPDGKYKRSRIRKDTIAQWFPGLPKDLRQIVAKELDYYPHIPKEEAPVASTEAEQQTLLDVPVAPARRVMM